MSSRGWIRERISALFRRARMDAEMDEELRFHVEMETEKNMRAGMAPREARRRALVAFGGVERFREKTRDERGVRPLEDFIRDLRFSFRTLRKAPAVVVVAVLSLGLGIGVSATVFSMARSLVFGEAGPLGEPEQVVAIYSSGADGALYGETSFPDFADIESETATLAQLAAHRLGVLTVGQPDSRDRMIVELVTGNYFQVLGVEPPLGRSFRPEEAVPGASERLIVLSHRAWKDRYGEDRDVLGRTLELDGEPFTIIGVAPPGLRARYMNIDVDGWVPLGVQGGIYRVSPGALRDRQSRQFFMLGRLAPGRTLEEAQAEMGLLAGRMRLEYPESWGDLRGGEPRSLTVVSEAESRVPPTIRAALLGTAGIVLGGALMILLLACSNVASLLLARARGRSWEMGVRMSLGARRGRLFRMLLAESTILSFGGAALGLVLARTATRYLDAIPLPMDVPLRFDYRLDGSVLAFTLFLALGSTLLAGIVPALKGSKANVMANLKHRLVLGSGREGRVTLRSLLVVGQVAAATFFVIGAGLALRSVQASAAYDVGLNPRNVAVYWQEPPEEGLPAGGLRDRFLALAERVQAHPEVDEVALARIAEAHVFMTDFATALVERDGEEPLQIEFNAVTPGYFRMLEIPLIRGRPIQSTDVEGATRVAVVNETFLERFFPDRDGLGERFRVSAWLDENVRQDQEAATVEVVGVVPSPEGPDGVRPRPFFWVSFLQDSPVRAIVLAKGRGGAEAIVPVLREEELTPGTFTPVEPGVYADYIEYRFLGHKIVLAVLSFAGVFALILAFIGVFGIVAFAVGRRFREMAIRQAMGAKRSEVVRALLLQSLRGTSVGIVIGLAAAVPVAFLARSVLLGVRPLDPIAVGGGTLLLVAAALGAALLPVRRLLRAEPMDVLRED